MPDPYPSSAARRPRPGNPNTPLWIASLALLLIGGVIWYFILQEGRRSASPQGEMPPAQEVMTAPPAPLPTSLPESSTEASADPASLLEITAKVIGPQTMQVRIRNGSLRGLRSGHVLFFAQSDLRHPFAELTFEHIGPRRAIETEMNVPGVATMVEVGQSPVPKVDATDFTAR